MHILLEEEIRVAQAAGRSPLLQLTYPSTVKKQDCFGLLQTLPVNRQPSGYGSTFTFSLEFPPTLQQSMDSEELLPFSSSFSSSSSSHTCSQAKTTVMFWGHHFPALLAWGQPFNICWPWGWHQKDEEEEEGQVSWHALGQARLLPAALLFSPSPLSSS